MTALPSSQDSCPVILPSPHVSLEIGIQMPFSRVSPLSHCEGARSGSLQERKKSEDKSVSAARK